MFITRRYPLFLHEAPEDGAQAPNVETPETAATEAAPTQQEVDWAKRYSDLQPEYTRATQEAAQLRKQAEAYQALLTSEDPDTRRQAAEILGFEIDEETDDTQHQDPYDQLRAEIQALKGEFSQRAQQEQQQAQIAQMEQHAENEMNSLGLPQDDSVRDWIVSRAVALPPAQDGMLDIRAAHQEFEALITAQKKQWADTKRTHAVSPVGQAGTQTPDWDAMSRSQRDEYMTERIRSLEQQ